MTPKYTVTVMTKAGRQYTVKDVFTSPEQVRNTLARGRRNGDGYLILKGDTMIAIDQIEYVNIYAQKA